MKIRFVQVGKVSVRTKGPPGFTWCELMTDGVHCNPNVLGPYHPTPNPPVFPGQCLAT